MRSELILLATTGSIDSRNSPSENILECKSHGFCMKIARCGCCFSVAGGVRGEVLRLKPLFVLRRRMDLGEELLCPFPESTREVEIVRRPGPRRRRSIATRFGVGVRCRPCSLHLVFGALLTDNCAARNSAAQREPEWKKGMKRKVEQRA